LTTSRADRVSIAEAALEKTASLLDNSTAQFPGESYGFAGIVYSQLAAFDLATNQTKYQDTLQNYFRLASEQQPVNFSGVLNYGFAAAMAYKTYKDPMFLEYARQSWWWGRLNTISQADLNTGIVPGKNFTVCATCQAITMAGGTFYVSFP
ncbi:hypothetical protein B0H17DRAFT_873198, partial [Mycena rosella]